MTEDLSELARVMAGSAGKQAALVIGFDGTAALLGHPDHYSLAEKLQGNKSNETLRSLVSTKIKQHADAYARYGYLREITQPRTGPAPGATAIQFIAGMLARDFINVVVASDPHKALYTTLAQNVPDLVPVMGDGSNPAHIQSFLKDQPGRRIFFDAGGLLIRGFQDGVRAEFGSRNGQDADYLRNMETKLEEFLGSCENIYCWGWSELDVPFHDICPRGPQPTVRAIGRYTKCGDLSNDSFEYDFPDAEDPGNAGLTTTNALERLAALLMLSPGTNDGGVGVRPDLVGITVPLLAEDKLNTFVPALDGRERAVHIVGIENETIRRSAANWLYRKVLSMGRPAVLQEEQDLGDLARYLTLQTMREAPQHLIGCFLGEADADEEKWQRDVRAMVKCWVSMLLRTPDPGHRITLFCPTWMSQWAGSWETKVDGVWPENYFDQRIINSANIEAWLDQTLRQMSMNINQPDLSRLAIRIAGSNVSDSNMAAGAIPEALALWLFELTDSQASMPDPRELSVIEILDAWDDLKGKYRVVTELLSEEPGQWPDEEPVQEQGQDTDLDFEVHAVLREVILEGSALREEVVLEDAADDDSADADSPAAPDDLVLEDFSLGEIRLRPPEEDEPSGDQDEDDPT